jgi:hypothetical protein
MSKTIPPSERMTQLIRNAQRQRREMEEILARVAKYEEWQKEQLARKSCSAESSQTNSTQQ